MTTNVLCLHEVVQGTFKFFVNFVSKTPVNVPEIQTNLESLFKSNCLVATNLRANRFGIHFIFPIKVTTTEASTMLQQIIDRYPEYKQCVKKEIDKMLRTNYSVKNNGDKDMYTPWKDKDAKRNAETLTKYSILE